MPRHKVEVCEEHNTMPYRILKVHKACGTWPKATKLEVSDDHHAKLEFPPAAKHHAFGQRPYSKYWFWAKTLFKICITGQRPNTKTFHMVEGTSRPAGNQVPFTVLGGEALQATCGRKIQFDI